MYFRTLVSCLILGFMLLSITPATGTRSTTPSDLTKDLGVGESARLSMLFEATIFKVDVATVDALLAPRAAAAVAGIARETRLDQEARSRVTTVLLDAQPFAVSMSFLRDASWDRFLDGTRKNLEGAAKAGIITEDEFQVLWGQFVADFAAMEERGVKKGDVIYYRVDQNRVRTVYFDGDRNVLVETDREGDARVRATRGAYFGPRSQFSKDLIRSLEGD
jgi:hypothetical protein